MVKRLCLMFLVAVVFSGCGSIRGFTNGRIIMPHYTVQAPPNTAWAPKKLSIAKETITLTRDEGLTVFTVDIIRNGFLDQEMKKKPAVEAAEYVMALERRIMTEFGVKAGRYLIEDIVTSEQTIGGKTFYTMKYTVRKDGNVSKWVMYLFFPDSTWNEEFVEAVCSVKAPAGVTLPTDYERDFEEVVGGISYTVPVSSQKVDARATREAGAARDVRAIRDETEDRVPLPIDAMPPDRHGEVDEAEEPSLPFPVF